MAKTYFVSRHPGALDWAARRGLFAERLEHLDVALVDPKDVVIGTLPVHLVAALCEKGARYFHLSLTLPPSARQRELSADEMEHYGARLEEFVVRRVNG